VWRTVYKGSPKELPNGMLKQRRRGSFRDVVISVNGGNYKYEPVPCRVKILLFTNHSFINNRIMFIASLRK